MSSITATRKRTATSDSSPNQKRRKPSVIQNKILNPINKQTGKSECFHKVITSLYLSLAPSYLNKPIEGIKAQHLDSLIMKVSPDLNGVILGYDNVRLTNESLDDDGIITATINPHSPFTFLWVEVEFLVWKPLVGDIVEGNIYMQSPSHIGLLINDTFNASIRKFNIPNNWEFIPNQIDEDSEDDQRSKSLGYWIDENKLPIDGKISFTIKAIHNSGRVISIEGSLVKPGSEVESLPVVPNLLNKKIKFDDEDELSNSIVVLNDEAGLKKGEQDQDLVPGYDNSSDEDGVIAQDSSSDDSDSDSD